MERKHLFIFISIFLGFAALTVGCTPDFGLMSGHSGDKSSPYTVTLAFKAASDSTGAVQDSVVTYTYETIFEGDHCHDTDGYLENHSSHDFSSIGSGEVMGMRFILEAYIAQEGNIAVAAYSSDDGMIRIMLSFEDSTAADEVLDTYYCTIGIRDPDSDDVVENRLMPMHDESGSYMSTMVSLPSRHHYGESGHGSMMGYHHE